VNGDGYADVIVFGVSTRTYFGNDGEMALLPRQLLDDATTPIPPGGKSDRMDGFRLALLGRTPFGRSKVKLEWEVKPLGTLFDGQGIRSSSSWMDTGTAGVSLSELVTGLRSGTPYHWRVRLRYHPAISPFQQYSRWITVPWNGWNETDLRTNGTRPSISTWLPLMLR
jgi:hypothetical protein